MGEGEILAGSVDSEARVLVKPEGIFVLVTPAQGEGRPVNLPVVERALAAKGIIDVDWSAVHQALQEQMGTPVLVAPRHPNLDRDAYLAVEVSQDQLEAHLVVRPPAGGRKVTLADAREALRAASVVEGIRPDQLQQAVASQSSGGGRFLVAAGRAAVNGNDGYIDYRFAVGGAGTKPLELEDGRVDYYNLQTLQNVAAGQLLAVRVAPTNGLPGVTVAGRPLAARPGRDVRLPKGKNTDAGANPDELVATTAGQVMMTNGKVGVFPIYEVRGDVDFGTGNIEFVGSIVIQGSVTSGFTLKATGNVEIKGSVEAATIIAEGDIIVHRGVAGGDRGRLVGRNIQAKFIQNCRVEASGDVVVDEALMYDDVQAQGKVEARGSKGRIVGGVVRAVREVSARVLGSKLGTRTEILVGVNPEVRAEFERVGQELQLRERQLDEVAKSIRVIKQAVAAGRPVPGGDAERLPKLASAMGQLSETVEDLRYRREELDTTLNCASSGLIKALDTCFPGVRITIGPLTTIVQDEAAKALYYIDSGEIRVGSA